MIVIFENYTLIIFLVIIILFAVSFKYENILVGKKVLNEFEDERNKKKFLFNQRINLLLYGAIALAVYIFPQVRKSEFIMGLVLIVLLRGIYLNKRYLNRWTIRK